MKLGNQAAARNPADRTLRGSRPSKGTFEPPPAPDESLKVQIDAGTLTLILEGIQLKSVKRRLRHRRSRRGSPES